MIDKILIGSEAVNHHDPNILQRSPKDEDYLSLHPVENADRIDGHGIIDQPDVYEFTHDIATIDEIYTLKVSHSFWDRGSWMKHIVDIRKLKDAGAVFIPELYSLAYKQWEQRYGKKNVNLDQDKTEFFGQNVRRKYDHDSIHASVAFNDNPMYMSILVDGEDVKVSKEKFSNLSLDQKRELVFEEVMVLSLERDLIPMCENKDINKTHLYTSYMKQLQMLITQYSKGWFPLWIVENYFEIAKPPLDYWTKFSESDKKVLL